MAQPPNAPTEEKRSQKRRNTIYYLQVFDMETGKQLGRMVDITTEGMMLINEEPTPTNVPLTCRMVLPAEILGRVNITFVATCMWCRRSVNPEFYEAGYRSIIADPGDIDAIEMLIQRFAFQDLDDL